MPSIRCLLFVALLFAACLPASRTQAAAFLFDATKAETAGNADWVIDEDNNTPQRIPTPAASGITASTTESYWTGALSAWGVSLVQLGHTVETLPASGRITYGDSSNAQDLSRYKVFVVCEPNTLFTSAEKTAIVRFVQNGGGLFIISDHADSDRNNDGYDSVAVWNDLFSTNGVQANPFGVTINSTNISLTSSAVDTSASDPLTRGPQGAVSQLKFSNGATLTLDTTRNASVQAAFWSSSAHTNSNVMAAYGTFGAGRFAIVGDSSPSDDGTGGSGNTLYAGWTELGTNHSRLYLNASTWLQGSVNGPPVNDAFAQAAALDSAATSAAGSNVNATKETGEPTHAGKAGGTSVWWQFTAAASGTATISTAGSSFDTLLAVYTGAAVNALSAVASNDNDGSLSTSRAAFAVTAGTTYRIAVDGAVGATGSITLALSLPQPPVALTNDNFINAYTLTGAAANAAGNNASATKETGEPSHGGRTSSHSLWWTWTAPASGSTTVSTAGSSYDTTLGVYTGSAVGALTTIASSDDVGTGDLTSKATFTATASVAYRIAVDGYNNLTGDIKLSVAGQAPPTPVASIAATTSSAAEKGQTPGVFTMTLNPAPTAPLTVLLRLGGTATLNEDYSPDMAASDDGTVAVAFAAGQTSAVLNIFPEADSDPTEGDETVTAALLSGSGYAVNSAAATATVTIRDNTPYGSGWSAAYRSQGFSGANAAPDADPDSDGVSNLLEYAFNLNPVAPDAAGLPSVGTGSFVDPADSAGGARRFLTLTLVRRTDAANLTYAVEACNDLAAGNWTSAGAVFVSASVAGMPSGTEQAVYRAAKPLDGPNGVARQYLRVRVTAAP